jgi:hypothetical protein
MYLQMLGANKMSMIIAIKLTKTIPYSRRLASGNCLYTRDLPTTSSGKNLVQSDAKKVHRKHRKIWSLQVTSKQANYFVERINNLKKLTTTT